MKKSHVVALAIIFASALSCNVKEQFYTAGDFASVPKTDVHLHLNSLDPFYPGFAEKHNFRIVSPNVNSSLPVRMQLDTSSAIRQKWPERFAFLGTFDAEGFGRPGYAERIINDIDDCMKRGASGIKIWKNIGMTLRDSSGGYVMIDDPAFETVFSYLEAKKIPVMGHLGEPRNCWLPLNEMTDSSNARYYRSNPQYHMYLHPEAPSYEEQIDARDNVLKRHPGLIFIGAHFGSIEWSMDELAKRLDSFPNFSVDMSARIGHLQYQSIRDYDKVRSFLIKYQDRLMYGTDLGIGSMEKNPESRAGQVYDRWMSNWIYLATDSTQQIRNIAGDVRGMHLPKEVIDKIFNGNAVNVLKLK